MLESIKIPVEEANKEISDFMNFPKELKEKSNTLSAKAKEYYNSEIGSYIFEKDKVLELFNIDANVNGLRVYYGFNSKNMPTLVLVACQATHDENGVVNHVTNVIASKDFAAVEWPTGREMYSEKNKDKPFNILDDNF